MKCLLVILVHLISFSLLSQISDLKKDLIIERTIEFIGEANENADIDYTMLIEDYYLFLDNPINLNQATFDNLHQLNLLSDLEINAILDYRYRYSHFLTVYELTAISELDAETVSVLLPFIYIGNLKEEKINWKDVLKRGRHDILLRYQRVPEKRKGYGSYADSILEENPNLIYQGNPDKYYARYRYTYKNKLSFGVTAEKDPGEAFFKANNKQGFDFYSSHLMLNSIGIIKRIVVGDYHANFGQGLNIWTGFNMGRTVQTLKVKQFGGGLRPYTSANESQFFRGVGITFNFNRFETTFFGSYKKIDASLSDSDTLNSENIISNFQLTGYHRTLKEIERKNAIGQLVFGTATSFQTKKIKINFTGLYSQFSGILEESQLLYKQFSFSGESQLSLGIDYQYVFPKMTFFGEVSSALNWKINTINGCLWRIDPKLDLVVVHRYFDKANQNLFGNNFTRSSQNGVGAYVGIETKLTSKIKASVYYDQSKSDWLKYLVDGPSVERSFLGQINYAINRYAIAYLRVRGILRERNVTESTYDISPQSNQQTLNLRLHYSQSINSQFSVKSRIEFSQYEFNGEQSNGLLMYQDIIYSLKNRSLKLYARYTLFDTDDYNSRIYTYENDLLYVFSVPSMFYQGFRTYLMAKYEIGSRIDIWLRWSRTSYTNRDTISLGLEQIDGNHKSELKAQLKIRL